MSTAPLVPSSPSSEKASLKPALARCVSRSDDELHAFRTCLHWMCLDQSGRWRATVSWSVFFVLAVAVPTISHFGLSFQSHRRNYDLVVQVSLSAAAALSFVTLSAISRRHGLRRFLSVDKHPFERDRVRRVYIAQLGRSFRILAFFVSPCFAAEVAYKVWWYAASGDRVPFLTNSVASDCAACALELSSWIYRTSIFFLVCVLFRLTCHLQILRLQDFAGVFQMESDIAPVLKEHCRVRRQLKIISHRFRGFILVELAIVTASQFAALLVTLRPHSDDSLFNTGELTLCSVVLVTGLLICLRSAAKITHKAQALTGHAAKWHVCATIGTDPEAPAVASISPDSMFHVSADELDSGEELPSDDDELDGTKLVYPHFNTVCFQRRQALVTYLENNRAGITIFGFTLDRAWLHSVFMLEMTLFLWLFSMTIGIP